MDSNQQLQQKLFDSEKELAETKINLAETQNELDKTKINFVTTQSELKELKIKNDEKENEIQATQKKLEETETTLAETKNQFQVTAENLKKSQKECNDTKEKLLKSENKWKDLKTELEQMKKELNIANEEIIKAFNEIPETPTQIFEWLESKQPIIKEFKPINIGNIKLDLDQINKYFPVISHEEKMELLLSKMDEGIAYNVDEKQIFFKFRFEKNTYQELYINFTGDINRYKNLDRTKFISDHFLFQNYSGKGYAIYMELQGWICNNSTAYLFNVKNETNEKLALKYGSNDNIDFKNYLSQNNEVLFILKKK